MKKAVAEADVIRAANPGPFPDSVEDPRVNRRRDWKLPRFNSGNFFQTGKRAFLHGLVPVNRDRTTFFFPSLT